MGVGYNPKIVTSGLVMCLDAANIKSFRGEATTNLVASPKSITTGYGSTIPTRLDNQLTNFDGTFTAGSITGSGWIAYTSATTSNTIQYTTSWYVKAGTFTNPYFSWGGAHAGNRTNFNFNLITGIFTNVSQAAGENYGAIRLSDGWWQVWYSSTLTTGNAYYPQLDNGSGTMYVGAMQIEQKAFPTKFVSGTRGTTVALGGGWIDLSNNSNNVNFTNGTREDLATNSILFNGTSDFIRPNISHSYLSSSALEVVFNSANHSTGFRTIFGYRHNGGYSNPTIGSIYLIGNQLQASVITTSEVYRTVTSSTTIQTNTIYHVVLNKDTVNGNLHLIVNGSVVNSQTFNPATYAQWPSAGNFIGANILDIGKSTNTNSGQGWSTDFFNGRIYKLAVYNRILSLAQVQGNFAATRGRFGI